jgi:hypothetical protein
MYVETIKTNKNVSITIGGTEKQGWQAVFRVPEFFFNTAFTFYLNTS